MLLLTSSADLKAMQGAALVKYMQAPVHSPWVVPPFIHGNVHWGVAKHDHVLQVPLCLPIEDLVLHKWGDDDCIVCDGDQSLLQERLVVLEYTCRPTGFH
jgi:hypothetical protein